MAIASGALFAVFLSIDDLVTSLPAISKIFDFFDGSWNWAGKAYSLLVSVLVAVAVGIDSAASGLTFRQRNMKASIIALVIFSVWGLSLDLFFKPGVPTIETLVFQATMPGLAEELVYRGIAPAMLLGLIFGKRLQRGIPWTVVLVTAVLFGIWHGLDYSSGSFSFDPMPALFSFIGSIAGGWLRFNSGSLLFPVLAHSTANIMFHLSAFLI